MEHIEEAGIHSGDSACSLPPYTLAAGRSSPRSSARPWRWRAALDVVGLMNVQFAVKGGDIYVLEVNPRASRTVPFVAKATGVPIAKIAARVMAGETLSDVRARSRAARDHVAVKEAVFPFARFPGVDVILGPEMKSTGEVMGIDRDFGRAFAKSQLGAGNELPPGRHRLHLGQGPRQGGRWCRRPSGWWSWASAHRDRRHRQLSGADAACRWSASTRCWRAGPHIVDAMKNGEVQLVFNTTEGAQAIADSFSLRRAALLSNIPYYTTVAGVARRGGSDRRAGRGRLEVAPLQSYFRAIVLVAGPVGHRRPTGIFLCPRFGQSGPTCRDWSRTG